MKIPHLFAAQPASARAFRALIGSLASLHTERAYRAAATDLSEWAIARSLERVDDLDQPSLYRYLKERARDRSAATIQQRIVCLRRLFQACSRAGCTVPALAKDMVGAPRPMRWHAEDALPDHVMNRMLAAAVGASLRDLRDHALITLLYVTFVPIRSLRRLSVATFVRNPKGVWLDLGGGRGRRIPCPQSLAKPLEAYIQAAGIGMDKEGLLFRSIAGASGRVTERPLSQPDVYRIVRRCAERAGIAGRISPRQVRATGLVRHLRLGMRFGTAQELAGHGSARTTVRYAKPGTRRGRNRIAYRLEDLEAYWNAVDADYDYWDESDWE